MCALCYRHICIALCSGDLHARIHPCVHDKRLPAKDLFRHPTRRRARGRRASSSTLPRVVGFSHNVASLCLCLQHLVEKVWYAVTETCLAFTVFRDDFSPKFIALFTLLLFLKSFHWLAEDRVDYVSFMCVLPSVKIFSV